MLVGVLGDLESHCYLPDVLDCVAGYQKTLGREFELLVQVGDVSRGRALFDEAELTEAKRRHGGDVALPIHFVRGNHESHAALRALANGRNPAPVGPCGVLAWVEDGTVMDLDGVRVGFAGGALPDADRGVDPACFDLLRCRRPVHVLVSHDLPRGVSRPRPDGTPVGDPHIAAFLQEADGPSLVIFGHYHGSTGPKPWNRTAICMLPPAAHPPEDGSLGVLDCAARTFWVAGRESNVTPIGPSRPRE